MRTPVVVYLLSTVAFAVSEDAWRYMIPDETDAFSDKMIQYINYLNTTWKAGRNPGFEDPAYVCRLLGVHPENQRYRLPERRLHLSSLGPLPENFDSRENWPECTTIDFGDVELAACCGKNSGLRS
ncbi:hypothetical protein HPB51_027118 [Rhipicephalus microplus]|uniref:Peptidase C1A propeptide domain-containing protein n=1 Tax=Rhipicephalus microplus TaxID=6941 RepID=A0A9J6D134_RHIMP|nr:hypothetical protein HPB51_027118 [Rhipicephalus microplus]